MLSRIPKIEITPSKGEVDCPLPSPERGDCVRIPFGLQSGNKIFFLICVIMLSGLDVAAEDIASRYSMPQIDERAPADSSAAKILKKAKVFRYAQEMPVKYTEKIGRAHVLTPVTT